MWMYFFCLAASDPGGGLAREDSMGSFDCRGGSASLPRQRPQMVELSGSDSYPSSPMSLLLSSLSISSTTAAPPLVFCLFAAWLPFRLLSPSPPFLLLLVPPFPVPVFRSISFRYRRETCLKVRSGKCFFCIVGQNLGLTFSWLRNK